MLDHISIPVLDYRKSRQFYQRALKPLGYVLAADMETHGGFEAEGRQDFWIFETTEAFPPIHVAFTCRTQETVT